MGRNSTEVWVTPGLLLEKNRFESFEYVEYLAEFRKQPVWGAIGIFGLH